MTRMGYERRLMLRRALGVVVPVLLVAAVVALSLRSETAPPAYAGVPRQQAAAAGASGVQLRVTPGSDGSLGVVEQVSLPEGTDRIQLAPPRVEYAGTDFGLLSPRATALMLEADGRPVSGAPADVVVPVQVDVPNGTRELTLQYVLRGTSIVSTPSSAGRARIALAPLTELTDDTERVVVLGSPGTRSVTCPLLPPEERLCVSGGGSQLVGGAAPGGQALFVLQVDLPQA